MPGFPFAHGGIPKGCHGGGCSKAANDAIEKRITETMEYLRAMGFTNEGGSLSNLVREKKGDLFAVLDILKAQQKSA